MTLSRRRLTAVVAAACAAALAATGLTLLLGSPAGAIPGCVPPPGDFDHSIPAPIAGPAVAPLAAPGMVSYATLGGDKKFYLADEDITTPDLLVSPLNCLGGGAVDTPALAEYAGGRALFVLAPTLRVYESYTPDGSPDQTAWTPVPGAPAGTGAPAVVHSTTRATLDLFFRAKDNTIWHASRADDLSGTWSAWENLGGGLTGTPSVGDVNGTMTVVGRAPTGVLYQKRGTTGHWGGWVKLTGTTSASPAVASGFSAGRLDLFVTGTTGGLYQSTMPAGATTFSTFKRVDTELPPATKVAAAGASGRMMVFATIKDGATSVVGYDQYVPGLGWSQFLLAPYTCDDQCLPVPTAAKAADGTAQHRVTRHTPVG